MLCCAAFVLLSCCNWCVRCVMLFVYFVVVDFRVCDAVRLFPPLFVFFGGGSGCIVVIAVCVSVVVCLVLVGLVFVLFCVCCVGWFGLVVFVVWLSCLVCCRRLCCSARVLFVCVCFEGCLCLACFACFDAFGMFVLCCCSV